MHIIYNYIYIYIFAHPTRSSIPNFPVSYDMTCQDTGHGMARRVQLHLSVDHQLPDPSLVWVHGMESTAPFDIGSSWLSIYIYIYIYI